MHLMIQTLLVSFLFLTGIFLADTRPAYAVVSTCVASLDGSQEVPPIDADGAGSATMTFNSSNSQLAWFIEFDELTGPATAAHFHGPASAEANAEVQVDIGEVSGLTSPMNGSAVLSTEQVAFLLQGLMYINIHTESNPDGEIRGEVSCVVPQGEEWQTIPLVIGDEQFTVQYVISDGTLDELTGNPEAGTITATISGGEEGELTIKLPRNVTDSVDENGQGSNYMVLVDGVEAVDTVDDFGGDARTLVIPFVPESERIDIIGTFLVPEFGASTLFLTVAALTVVGMIVALGRNSKFSLLSRK